LWFAAVSFSKACFGGYTHGCKTLPGKKIQCFLLAKISIIIDNCYQIIANYSRIHPTEFSIIKVDRSSLFKIRIDAINNLTG
jgi:hypothetical protein